MSLSPCPEFLHKSNVCEVICLHTFTIIGISFFMVFDGW
jgi:hypothetical protein